jgi:hypothetical protein
MRNRTGVLGELHDGEKKKRDEMAPSLLRCDWYTIYRGLFRSIHKQLVKGDIQLLSQPLEDIRPGYMVLFLDSLNGDSGNLRLFRQSLYRIATTFTPVLQDHLQIFFIRHIFFTFLQGSVTRSPFSNSKTYVQESQHKTNTILTHFTNLLLPH